MSGGSDFAQTPAEEDEPPYLGEGVFWHRGNQPQTRRKPSFFGRFMQYGNQSSEHKMATWKYNILVTPMLVFRVPIVAAALSFLWLGDTLGRMGSHIPGWRKWR